MSRSRPSKRDRALWNERRRIGLATTERKHRRRGHAPFPSYEGDEPPKPKVPPRQTPPRPVLAMPRPHRPTYRRREPAMYPLERRYAS